MELAEHAAHDFRQAPLEPRLRALCEYAEKLTLLPVDVGAGDVEALRAERWSDAAFHDAIQVIAYFNYINRVAEGVGTADEPEWHA